MTNIDLRTSPHPRGNQSGVALIELIISTAAMAMVSGIIYTILNTGMVLFAKNTAINISHQQARVAVLQMEEDLHSAISLPQLVDATRTPVAGSGPAAGISFQLHAQGPFQISAAAAAGQNQVQVAVNGYTPKAGQRLCVPTHQCELDITAVGAGTTNRMLTLESNVPYAINIVLESEPVNVACFITDRVSYAVVGNELRYYGRENDNTYRVMANYITTPTPFSIPATAMGAQYNRFVAAINLSTVDPGSSNRNFKAANMFLNAMVPYRARICTYQ